MKTKGQCRLELAGLPGCADKPHFLCWPPQGKGTWVWAQDRVGCRIQTFRKHEIYLAQVETGEFMLEHHSQMDSNERRKYKKETPKEDIMRCKRKRGTFFTRKRTRHAKHWMTFSVIKRGLELDSQVKARAQGWGWWDERTDWEGSIQKELGEKWPFACDYSFITTFISLPLQLDCGVLGINNRQELQNPM